MLKLRKRGMEPLWVIVLVVLLFIVLMILSQVIKNIIEKGTAQ